MAFPIDQLTPDVAALFKHLECPVCLEVKADTLTICKSGHACCRGCYGAMNGNRCPTCREYVIGPVPNQPVNALAQALGIVSEAPEAPAPPPQAAAVQRPAQPADMRRRDGRSRAPLPHHLATSPAVSIVRKQVAYHLNKFNKIKIMAQVNRNLSHSEVLRLGNRLRKTLDTIGGKLQAFNRLTNGYPYPGVMPDDCGYDRFGHVDRYGGDGNVQWMDVLLSGVN